MPVQKPKDMRGSLRRIWNLTRGHRRGLGWVLLFSAFVSLSAIVSPLLIGQVINLIFDASPALWMLALLLGVYVLDWLARFLQKYLMASVAQKMILSIRTALFAHMESLSLAYFDRKQHGELMSRLTNDVDNIASTISDSLSLLMTYCFTVVGIFAIMVSLNVVLTCVALVAVGLIFALTRVITRHTRVLFERQQQALGDLNGHIEESIAGLPTVKAFRRERLVTGQFEQRNERYRAVATRAIIWSGFLMPITNVINNLCFVAIAVTSGLMAAQGMITVGLVSSFLLYSRQFSRPFVSIANIYNSFQTAVAGAERVFEVLDEAPDAPDKSDAIELKAARGDIEFRGVRFGYNPESPVLRGIDLHIPAGTRLAVVGPTGSGKTTFINLLTRFYDVDDGSIMLDGRDVRDYRLHDLRRVFGVVLQDTALFGMSVADNISYGQAATREAVEAAARAAGADGFIKRLPEGYDTVLAQGGAELSQGQRQMLTIARTLLADAPILILDEATSSVDTMTEARIRRAIVDLSQDRTSIIIAHRLSTIVDSDMIILIESGRIVEKGTHDELMRQNGRYAAMYRTQSGMC